MSNKLARKAIGVLLGAALMIPTGTGALAASTSVQQTATGTKSAVGIEGHWAQAVMQDWKDKGYINGYADGELHPNNPISRAELAALINRSSGFTATSDMDYRDVSTAAWYFEDVAKADTAGYMKGDGNGSFRPVEQVTRQELAVVLTSLSKLDEAADAATFTDTANSPAWSKGAIGAVSQAGLMLGNAGRFNPTAIATRAEVVTVLDRAMKQVATEAAVTYAEAGIYGPEKGTETIQGSVNITQAGVTLRNTVIEGDLLLGEAIANGDVTLDNVTVKGTTKIEGGGPNSIHVVDSVLITVLVDKRDGSVRIVTEGNSQVSQITLQSGAYLQENGTGSGFADVLLSSLIPTGSTVRMAGQFETLAISAASLNVNLSSGTIGEVTIEEGAPGTNLNVSGAARITQLILNAVANVTGTGTVANAQVNASGVTFQNAPQQMSVGNGVVAPSVTPPAATGTGSGGNVGGAAPAPTSPTAPTTPNTPAPVTDYLDVTNGSASLRFLNAVNDLTVEDLSVTATVTGVTYTLEDVRFDTASNTLTFKPFSLDTYYGRELKVDVSPAAGTNKFTTTLSGTARIEGFSGTITDVDNRPVEGMRIDFRRGGGNLEGTIATSVVTDASGRYTAYVAAAIYTGVTSKAGFIPGQIITVGTTETYNASHNDTAIKIPASDEIRIVLTWGEYPRDEDSHLLGPVGDGYGFHTWYGDKQAFDQGELVADLDHDDVSSYGPETTTIRQKVDGTYQFYVHNYSGNGDGSQTLKNSGAKVDVYVGDQTTPMQSYAIPTGESEERYWYVFDMTINNGVINFVEKNQLDHQAPAPLYSSTRPNATAILNNEADKLLSVTEVTYQQLGDVIPLTANGSTIREDITLNIKKIQEYGVTDTVYTVVDNVYTVTGDVYVGTVSNNIVLTNYNTSEFTVSYNVTVELSFNGQTITRHIELNVHGIRVLLEQAIERGTAVLAVNPENELLQEAYNQAVTALESDDTAIQIQARTQLLDQL